MKFFAFVILFFYVPFAHSIEANDFALLKPTSVAALVGLNSVSNGGGSNVAYGAALSHKLSKYFGFGLEYTTNLFTVTSNAKSNLSFFLANAFWYLDQSDDFYIGIKAGTSSWTAAGTGTSAITASSSIAAGPMIGANFAIAKQISVGGEVNNIWQFSGIRKSNLQIFSNIKFWF